MIRIQSGEIAASDGGTLRVGVVQLSLRCQVDVVWSASLAGGAQADTKPAIVAPIAGSHQVCHSASQRATQQANQPARESQPTNQPARQFSQLIQPTGQPANQRASHPATQQAMQPASQPSFQPDKPPTSQPASNFDSIFSNSGESQTNSESAFDLRTGALFSVNNGSGNWLYGWRQNHFSRRREFVLNALWGLF